MKAIVFLSGGLDSTVCLVKALHEGRDCIALSFDYGQRHKIELEAAKEIAEHYQVDHKIIKIDSTPLTNSALIAGTHFPKTPSTEKIPPTYVPGRNTIFLAYATALAESTHAKEIYFGCNIQDSSPYPDCRPSFIDAWQNVLNLATKQAVEGSPPKLITPLISLDKKEIVQLGTQLNAPLHLTKSCYNPDLESGAPCEICDACQLRKEGFGTPSS